MGGGDTKRGPEPIQIDVISDTVCPWCYVGKRRLGAALKQRPDLPVNVTWRPYQLNPDMPEDGVDHKEYYTKKFGAEQSRALVENLTEVGKGEGLDLRFDRIKRSPNTLASHRLIRWAGSAGTQDDIVEALFSAYFTEGRDIGDPAVLVEIAGAAGMDATLVGNLLAEGRDTDLVKNEILAARQMGVQGVPFFIMGFDVGQKYGVSGAQPAEAFLQALDTLAKSPAYAAAPS